MAAYTSTVTIEELEGQERSIQLTGGGLPHAPTEWISDLNVKTTWYPGNGDEATQQVLGPQDPPTKWAGTWRRTMLSRTPAKVNAGGAFAVADPHVLADAVEALQRSGARLRVTWSSQTPEGAPVNRVREGRLKRFTTKYDRVTDVHWEMEWEWVGRGIAAQKVAATRDASASSAQDALASELSNFQAVVNDAHFQASNRTIPNSASALSLGQLEAFANAPLALVNSISRQVQQQVSALQQVGQIASTLANEPFAIAAAVTALAQDVTSTSNAFYDQITAQPVEAQSLKFGAAELARTAKTFGQSVQAQQVLARAATTIAQQQRAKLSSNPGGPRVSARASSALQAGGLLAVHVTKDGDTPVSISQRYYKSPDRSVDLLKANHLPWTQVTFARGTTLIVPVLSSKQGL